MRKFYEDLHPTLNKKMIITALGVAALGVQMMQTTDIKADTISDTNNEDNIQQSSDLKQNTSTVADDSSIQPSENTNEESAKPLEANIDSSEQPNVNAENDTDTLVDEKTDTADVTNPATTTSSSDVMTVGPDQTKADSYTDPIKKAVSLSATNENGTVTSPTTDELKNDEVNVDSKAKTTVNYTLTNTANTPVADYGTILILPNYNAYSKSNIVMSDTTDLSNYIKNLPTGAKVTYSTTDNDFLTYEEQIAKDPNFKLSSLMKIKIDPAGTSLAAGQTISVAVPLTVKDTTPGTYSNATFGVYTPNFTHWKLTFMSAYYNDLDESSSLTGQYLAVTVKDGTHTAADSEIQSKMPTYESGSAIQVNNFNRNNSKQYEDGDKTVWTRAGYVTVNLVSSSITNIANNDGYSVLLNSDGSQTTTQSFAHDYTVGIQTGTDNPGYTDNNIKGIFISLRQVINTNDNTTKVGNTWNAEDNLTSVLDNTDKTLTGDDAINAVTTNITDNDGVLNNGKVVKAGTFTVEYTFKLKDGTSIKKTVEVTADPATNSNSGSSSSGHHSGSSTTDTTPLVSPNDPDSINDVQRLVSTHPNEGNVTLYTLDTSSINDRLLKPATDWFSDKEMTFAGITYYRVATNEWVKAPSVYVYENKNQVVQTNNQQTLINSEGNVVTNRSLAANSAWVTDRIAYINGKTYYRVATNEFVATDAVTVL